MTKEKTKFIFVRHGEPDYPSTLDWQKMSLAKNFAGLTAAGREQIKKSCKELKKYDAELIISSPFTRTMQGAAIMARELDLDVVVEHNLHEWQADLTFMIENEDELRKLVKEYNDLGGVYPEGETRVWETKEHVRSRVMEVLKKYSDYRCVIVSGHGMMTQAVLGYDVGMNYGQIIEIEI